MLAVVSLFDHCSAEIAYPVPHWLKVAMRLALRNADSTSPCPVHGEAAAKDTAREDTVRRLVDLLPNGRGEGLHQKQKYEISVVDWHYPRWPVVQKLLRRFVVFCWNLYCSLPMSLR